jgi:hypothetical protein
LAARREVRTNAASGANLERQLYDGIGSSHEEAAESPVHETEW